ncbi:MAG TPA: xanthine dehydrogenase family protein molybdopterin-binding subunit [Candidatus Binatia bacterium]|jgi:4-hydroxybenzoyl-CoA reductase alpha subunit|nr:xanthine dehydrogenase family protein molybdopterin-binding subunit [Candidatus Binatia bacterium]
MAKAEKFSVVGHRVQRVEGYDKVTGESKYIADIQLPGMLIGKILRSPYPHARILHIDTSKAAKLRGVRAVVTAEDTIKRPWGAFFADQYILSVGKTRYVGEEVAAVAALDGDVAEEAIDLIEVEWEPLPAVFDAEQAMQDGAPLIHEDKPNNIAMTMDIERGNMEKAFAESDLIIEDTFQSMPQWHCAIETIGSVAQYAPDGKYTIYMNTQTLFSARLRIAAALGVPESDVRIIQSAVGGGFGGKSCDDNNALVAAVLARKAGKPVKIINSREEEFLAGCRPRVFMKINVKLGFKGDGRIRAKHIRVIADNGAYSAKAPAITGVAAMRHDTCYKYTDVKTQAYLVYTNKIPTGAFRGFGNPSAEWAVEQAIDIGAHQLGMDPMEIARINAAEAGYVSPHGNRVTSCELKQCLDMTETMMDWKNKRAEKKPNTGLGLACTVHVSGKRHFGDYDGSSATIKINEDGKALILSGEGECGQGVHTVMCQIAAEELGIPVEDVEISRADTDLTTFCLGAFASRLTYISGNAVKNAATAVKKQLFEQAAEILEANPDDLVIHGGRVSVKGAEHKSVTVADVARARLFRHNGAPIVASGSFDADSVLPDSTRFGNESGAYNYGAQAAYVSVDQETGQVKVLQYVIASDCGTVIYPIGAEGQVEGGLAQGIGYALTEGLQFDEGRPVNPNFSDYRIPSMRDMPPLIHAFAESYEPTGPFGAKGLGELNMDPTAAVISNAIFDAVGVRIRDLPITPEKVLRALREKAVQTSPSHD